MARKQMAEYCLHGYRWIPGEIVLEYYANVPSVEMEYRFERNMRLLFRNFAPRGVKRSWLQGAQQCSHEKDALWLEIAYMV